MSRYDDDSQDNDYTPPVWLVVVVLAVLGLLMVRAMGLEGWIR